jgi:hypothetical protein
MAEDQVFHCIRMEFEHGRPLGDDMVFDWWYTGHHPSVLPDTLLHVIRPTDAFKIVFGISIESGR